MKNFVKTVFIVDMSDFREIICYLLDNFPKEQISLELIFCGE